MTNPRFCDSSVRNPAGGASPVGTTYQSRSSRKLVSYGERTPPLVRAAGSEIRRVRSNEPRTPNTVHFHNPLVQQVGVGCVSSDSIHYVPLNPRLRAKIHEQMRSPFRIERVPS